MKPRLLDLYCCEGGASQGYALAGFKVSGVDLFRDFSQKRYPFRSYRSDAVAFVERYGRQFDVIAASPPCQHASAGTRAQDRSKYPRLIEPTRDALKATGKPYVIENVAGSALVDPLVLCGTMFGLRALDDDGTPLEMWRHRHFESNLPLVAPIDGGHRLVHPALGHPVDVHERLLHPFGWDVAAVPFMLGFVPVAACAAVGAGDVLRVAVMVTSLCAVDRRAAEGSVEGSRVTTDGGGMTAARKPKKKVHQSGDPLCFHGRPACAFCGLNVSQTERLERDKKSRPKPPPLCLLRDAPSAQEPPRPVRPPVQDLRARGLHRGRTQTVSLYPEWRERGGLLTVASMRGPFHMLLRCAGVTINASMGSVNNTRVTPYATSVIR